jgi:transposase
LSLQQITASEAQLKQLDAAIPEQLAALNIPNTLTTIPGIGPVLAAGLIAEVGDVRHFNCDDDKVAKLASFKWRRHQSADFVADDTPITRHGNRYLRYYFCEAAQLVRIHEPEYTAFYQKKYDEALSQTRHRPDCTQAARPCGAGSSGRASAGYPPDLPATGGSLAFAHDIAESGREHTD